MLLDPALIPGVTKAFRTAVPEGFIVDRSGVERHGSWEWMATRRDPDLRRVVILALTEQPSLSGPARLDLDLWAAAETDRAYFSSPVLHRAFAAEDGTDWVQELARLLSPWLATAGERTEQLSAPYLLDGYVEPETAFESRQETTLHDVTEFVLSRLEPDEEITVEELAARLEVPDVYALGLLVGGSGVGCLGSYRCSSPPPGSRNAVRSPKPSSVISRVNSTPLALSS
jgi:hypothetical protein